MKKTLFLLLIPSLIFTLTGCRVNGNSLSDSQIKEKLATEIKENISIEVENVKVIIIKDFHDRKIALIAYDLLSDHYVSYRLFEVKKMK